MSFEEDKLSIEDRQRLLNEISDKYLRGFASKDDLKKAESDYGTDYGAAALEVAGFRRQIKYELSKLKRLLTGEPSPYKS
jgi:hypothetical protein